MTTEQNRPPISDGLPTQVPDTDPEETSEWLDSLDGLLDAGGRTRARYVVQRLLEHARKRQIGVPSATSTDYINTIPVESEPYYPGDEEIEHRIRAFVRWNAAMTVHRAQRPGIGVGGHISTYASAANLYEVGYNHFFRGRSHPGGGDQVFFQGHASPGMYARSFVEGRLSADDLDGFRQEVSRPQGGLPSYPHPRLMPDYWQFPTVSMGLGPINAIYQALFNRYAHDRGLKDTADQQVWAFLGDGEMDEVESRGALQFAAGAELDNLTFVVNCNLQRLDGPVRGNGKIVQELEAYFRGAGWNVIKVIWGSEWDPLLASDNDGALVNLMNTTPDGDFQTFKAESGAFIREHFFGRDVRTKEMAQPLSDDDIWNLRRGGHDDRKIYAAYKAAMEHEGQPTVILAHTVKGYRLGSTFEGRNATHQMKKLSLDDLKGFRDALDIPVTDAQLEADPYQPPYLRPEQGTREHEYLHQRRSELGGSIPSRQNTVVPMNLPGEEAYKSAKRGSGKQKAATTMAVVRLLKDLMRDKETGKLWVPIIPDEARTFGMDAMFPTAKIYSPHGQQYLSVDRDLFLSYKESEQGQLMHLGINEAGSMAAFTAAGSASDTLGVPTIPFYIFYSMFGFQRTADAIWAASDQLANGFLIGATAGRTTLNGEGLQHEDGHSILLAHTNPAVLSYDPAFGYEIGHIVQDGLRRMYGEGEHVFYYLTVYNEPIVQPAEPENVDVEGILKGLHKVHSGEGSGPRVQLLTSGSGMQWAQKAADLLAADWGVAADIWSVTSWSELNRDAVETEKHNLRHPEAEPQVPYVTSKLSGSEGPFVAVSDYMRSVPDLISRWVPGDYTSLGTDGFGHSDTRGALRRYFNVDGESVTVAALQQLAARGELKPELAAQAAAKYQITDPTAAEAGEAGGDS
ncbi:pyruvate dehydrogenase (acetyl-transferring), homodimeric type [Glycomyces buryatensis]|uniref:Pyruvate dehydrogenase E1 component n=1 Tax=Glycomyces buryatensis TaxID=2570927 RepID=A0A4S8PRN4_9ACTN|nr:pyruvate dehydrogenase (acetyl-transferring), homodimeric type [Glycomyces buryatensis]THV33907.1 pyruvate dehydrogenase (acetyl-transferring), homodimeric type [Glycomyces buryatensis]